MLDQYHLPTQVIAASLRGPQHVERCALAGAHIATLPFSVIEQMLKHPLTDKGIDAFLADWRSAQAQLSATPVS